MRHLKFTALLAAGAIALVGCSSSSGGGASQAGGGSQPAGTQSAAVSTSAAPSASTSASASASGEAMGDADVMTAAANLRTDLNFLLGEHLLLASKATGAALGGRTEQFDAYGGLLNTNGTDLGAAIGSVYGQEAEDEFNRIWSAHNGFFVDYTTGVATDDTAAQEQAVEDLETIYVPEFSAFLAGATGLPEDALAEGIQEHVDTTIAIIDAQGAGDAAAAAEADRAAGQHMKMLGDTLAPAIVAAQPESFQ
jgi:hypothetical protein